MKLNTTPRDTAEFGGGVLQTTEFKIKTSAKAFEILSSGLYANKIRAILRELGCNAYDSHVSAGWPERPFDVHLPTTLEPYFAIRDYGIGLDHQQVVTIFTTYFESSKTESNELIGGLGLGSKAPFSYTNNFTVTAVKNGIRGIYTAFVSDSGVPSVALMNQSETDDHNGVEIQFAVDNQYDFHKFYDEAQQVYSYFATWPTWTGHEVTLRRREYAHENVAPGIHLVKTNRGSANNVAIMGNIPYPIDLPNLDKLPSELTTYHRCGLEIHFAIGEIDFQASREGLSYTAGTVAAIVDKYQEFARTLRPAAYKHIKTLRKGWAFAWDLEAKAKDRMWKNLVEDYIKFYKPVGVEVKNGYIRNSTITLKPAEIEKAFNIKLELYDQMRYGWGKRVTAVALKPRIKLQPSTDVGFLINTEKRSIVTRLRDAVKAGRVSLDSMWVMTAKDPKQPMLVNKFMKFLGNPPEERIYTTSILPSVAATAKSERVVQLVQLKRESINYNFVWSDEYYSADEIGGNGPFYYIPIKGFAGTMLGKDIDVKEVCSDTYYSKIIEEHALKVFGVRSKQLAAVQQDPRFVLLETMLVDKLNAVGKGLAYSGYVNTRVHGWLKRVKPAAADSKFTELSNKMLDTVTDISYTNKVCKHLDIDLTAIQAQAKQEVAEFNAEYPLLQYLDSHTEDKAVEHYINLIDTSKE